MQSTINERVKAIVNELYSGNVTAMAKATYISRTSINSVIGEQESAPGFDFIKKLAEIRPQRINLNWLILGVGEMFSEDATSSSAIANGSQANSQNGNNNVYSNNAYEDVVHGLLSQLEEKDRQIEKLLNLLSK